MSNGNSQQTFKEEFSELAPMIREEWPQVDEDALEQTQGDMDLVVALISSETEHSKALVRKQLNELQEVRGNGDKDAEVKRLRRMVDRLQTKSQDVAQYVRQQMVTDAKEKVGQNPLVALLMAIGLGFVFGFILRGLGRGR